jgi:hypothetical protein
MALERDGSFAGGAVAWGRSGTPRAGHSSATTASADGALVGDLL